MDSQFMEVTPAEIISLHLSSQRRGFILGVAFCVGVKYLYDRRKTFIEIQKASQK